MWKMEALGGLKPLPRFLLNYNAAV